MYKRILLAYDGSREGARALREGALIAKACCAQVFLLSVVPESGGVLLVEGAQGGVVSKMAEAYKEQLERGVARLKEFGFDPVARLVVGEPAPAIGAVAQEIGADLVVVGHRKQSLLSRWWGGSSGAYLSEHVPCSLLLCRDEISDEAFEAAMREAEGADA
ncbi:MAG TPA: universal stress protein [Caulobacteraceae bacterium]|nr:universal stress protein [Caulobacteraceae bacterium]